MHDRSCAGVLDRETCRFPHDGANAARFVRWEFRVHAVLGRLKAELRTTPPNPVGGDRKYGHAPRAKGRASAVGWGLPYRSSCRKRQAFGLDILQGVHYPQGYAMPSGTAKGETWGQRT